MTHLRITTLVAGLVLLCLAVANLSGQTTRGTILGTVSDQTGAVMPGVKITVTQLETGLSRTVETNADGYYVVPSLLPGKYSIQAEKEGFQTKAIKPIELNVDTRVQVNVTLEVGSVQGMVTVTTEGSLVEASSASLGQVIREKTIVDLPLNGRNFLQLALLSAGAAPLAMSGSDTAGASFRPSLSVSGGRESSNQFTIDGVFNNVVFSEGLNLQLSVDAIQEFKVQRNTFSAEFGQGTAIINVASKSGANNFHGTIFEFLRNDALDARQFFDAQVPPFRQNQFGFSFGGPIIKDKTFFFTNYEGFRRRRANTFVATLPTARQLSGDFSGANPIRDPLTMQPFPNNIIPPERISPLTKRIIAFLPKPTAGGASNFRTTRTEKNDFDQFTARVDHRAGTKDHLFVRYSLLDLELFTPGLIELSGTTTQDLPQNVGVQWTHLFSPSVVNEARVGFNRNLLQRLQEGAAGENILRFQNIFDDPINFGLPTINLAGFTGFGTLPSVPNLVGGNTYQFNDNLAWVRSSHTLKFGVDFRNLQLPHQPVLFGRGSFNFSGAATGNPVADFLLGHPFVSNGAGRKPSSYQSYHHFSWYAQDDWKVTPHFTLNYGLRYERISVVKERYRGRLG
ncbi:MAG: TonB-dependent receptor, partial [Acidobacteria bacterium]|nr:TonB-dependent receptor [Acidobacteriota bacterium]